MRCLVKAYSLLLTGLFLAIFSIGCGNKQKPIRFKKLSSKDTRVNFSNNIVESDSLNYFKFPYIYMGGGVAIGDINNDGLSDIFFTANMTQNKLYLNRGNLSFEDISGSSGISGDNRWSTGVTMVDVNSDGWLDIYVCASGKSNSENQLYINNQDETFSESAALYGLNDASPSIQSTFFDYDMDGDLDVFVGNYPLVPLSMGNDFYFKRMKDNKHESSGHLFRNNGDGTFSDKTIEAGVNRFGLTLGVIAADFNNDNWPDLYVSNDFQVPDYLYINNRDGSFSEALSESIQHYSMFGMGIDASDFNNDGLLDMAQLDMAPEDYRRAVVNMASMNPDNFWNMIDLGWHYQYMQNSLQVNRGVNTNNIPVFSEISRLSGIATTDWSWGVLFTDLDNDGHKDLLVTNGIRRDVNHNDILNRNKNVINPNPIQMEDVPSEPLANYVFHNSGDFKFNDVGVGSGFDYKGFSNGMAYGDLDNDGDMDVVVSNLDSEASIFENVSDNANNHIKFKIKGSKKNPFGLGIRITISTTGLAQTQELTLSRGFQSSVEPIIHFGIGGEKIIKEVSINWPDGAQQVLNDVGVNQVLTIDKKQATPSEVETIVSNKYNYNFIDVTGKSNIVFRHIEDPYDDFQYEPLLPHKNSRCGPSLSIGDVNNDDLEDFFIGNASGSESAMFLQYEDDIFQKMRGPWLDDAQYEDTGSLLFDPDGDGDLDLYVVSGGNDARISTSMYQDRLYINVDNKYIKSQNSLPEITTSGQVVLSKDYDLDGDEDLFIGGRIVPGQYPKPSKSLILRNDGGENNNIRFEDVTDKVANDFLELGLVTSAIWYDFNFDKWPDLIITGEWMPIRFFKNNQGTFVEVTEKMGMTDTNGWWYSLETVDVDNDDDLDIVAGNLGMNYKYRTGANTSFEIYANDFDENGKSDIVLSYSKEGKQFPVRGRECSSQQVPAISKRFETYSAFANADLAEIYGESMLEKSLNYKATTFAHHWIENVDSKAYIMHELPTSSQFSSINDIEILEVNGDSFPDLLIGGNLYGSEVETPRNDASFGQILENNTSKDFVSNSAKNGLLIRGEIRAIKPIKLGRFNTKDGYLFAINNDFLKLLVKN